MEQYLGTTWFVLWGVLWAVYFMLDGFDLGIGILLPWVTRNEDERRAFYRAIGPFWDGNEVWLITAGGVTFAAFPGTYAVMFSSLYSPLMLILFSLILRGAAVAFRSEIASLPGRRLCDALFFLSSFSAALLLGVAFANIFEGVALNASGVVEGGLRGLLNPYALLGGVLFVLLFIVHGLLWLAVKTSGALQGRMVSLAEVFWFLLTGVAVAFLAYSAKATSLFANYNEQPLLFAVPGLCVLFLLLVIAAVMKKSYGWAWVFQCATIAFAALFGVVGIYPALLPSSVDPACSMTIANSSSSPLTLKIMLAVAGVMVPIVILYQWWVYENFKDKSDGPDALGGDIY